MGGAGLDGHFAEMKANTEILELALQNDEPFWMANCAFG
jgi:hypothetical protein